MTTRHGTMPTTDAHRYIRRLCDHLEKVTHAHGGAHGSSDKPLLRSVQRTGAGATIDFVWGTCELTAMAAGLVIRVETDDEDAAAAAQHMITARINNFAARENTRVCWR